MGPHSTPRETRMTFSDSMEGQAAKQIVGLLRDCDTVVLAFVKAAKVDSTSYSTVLPGSDSITGGI